MTLVNMTGSTAAGFGVTSDETGINVSEFRCTVEPEYIEHLPNKVNEVRGSAIGAMKLTVSIDGEVLLTTGIMAATATAAVTVANSKTYFGAPSTGLTLTSGEVTESRDGWKSVSVSLEAFSGRAVS